MTRSHVGLCAPENTSLSPHSDKFFFKRNIYHLYFTTQCHRFFFSFCLLFYLFIYFFWSLLPVHLQLLVPYDGGTCQVQRSYHSNVGNCSPLSFFSSGVGLRQQRRKKAPQPTNGRELKSRQDFKDTFITETLYPRPLRVRWRI